MSTDMTGQVKAVATPILKVGMLRLPTGISAGSESGLTHKGREQAVGIVVEQRLEVQILRGFQRTVEQCYFVEVEVVRIERFLRTHGLRRG